MPSQRERNRTLSLTAVTILGIGAALLFVASLFGIGGLFYDISAVVFGVGTALVVVAFGVNTFENLSIFQRENKAARYSVSIDSEDRIFENRVLGDAVVRSPIAGLTIQQVTMAPNEQSAPFVRRNPIYLTHVASPLPVEERMSQEEYLEYENLFQGNGRGNGKEK